MLFQEMHWTVTLRRMTYANGH